MTPSPSPVPLPADLLADCAALLRRRAAVERRIYLPVGALAARGLRQSTARPEGDPGAAPASSVAIAAATPGAADAAPRTLDSFRAEIEGCVRCPLGHSRTRFVFGSGNPDADLMLVGEAPGREEDLQGVPFVGAAGELLTRILAAIDLRREEVYIANLLKCRPPGNREPLPEEIAACRPHLEEQIRLVSPRVVCALGRYAAQLLTGQDAPISRLRGVVHRVDGRLVIPTYHPSALLRNPSLKRATWEDMKLLRAELLRLGPR